MDTAVQNPLHFESATGRGKGVAVGGQDVTVEMCSSATGKPPYHAPKEPVYPFNAYESNRAYKSLAPQPVFEPIPADMLCRPAWLPNDADPRIDPESIWIGVAKDDLTVAYVVPPPCKGCTATGTEFCDRKQPSCSRCSANDLKCEPGIAWQPLKPPGKRRRQSNDRSESSSAERIAANALKPPMALLKSVPVWADSRAALLASLEYFRNPRPIIGGSVEIAKNGAARAVMLEGAGKGYWGQGEKAGTIAVFLGGNQSSPELTALFLAQRMRTPIALLVAEDYEALPYKLPRAYMALGWFWIIDSWIEPEHGWRCRFEWCPEEPLWWANVRPRPATLAASAPWTVGTTSDTVRQGDTNGYVCIGCKMTSERVFTQDTCLNQWCDKYFLNVRDPVFREPRVKPRLGIKSLGVSLRPPAPVAVGGDYWRGFVCHHCGQAAERTLWAAWECTNCSTAVRSRKILYAENLCPMRPLSAGPRADEGIPDINLQFTRTVAVYKDNLKTCRYLLGDGEIFLALNHQDTTAVADASLVDLQREDMPFVREGPYYTLKCGTGEIPWKTAPPTCVGAVDLMNERCGRVWAGHREFTSVLFNAMPPSVSTMRFNYDGGLPLVILVLGSDARLVCRRTKTRTAKAELTAQHGDVIGINTAGPLTIDIRLNGFGFVCIGSLSDGPPVSFKTDLKNKTDLKKTNKTDLNKTDLNKADLTDVNKTDLNKTDLNKADLTDVNKTDLNKTDLNKTDLNKTDLNKTDKLKTDLKNKTDKLKTDLRNWYIGPFPLAK